jgi:hypothetical protein
MQQKHPFRKDTSFLFQEADQTLQKKHTREQ